MDLSLNIEYVLNIVFMELLVVIMSDVLIVYWDIIGSREVELGRDKLMMRWLARML